MSYFLKIITIIIISATTIFMIILFPEKFVKF